MYQHSVTVLLLPVYHKSFEGSFVSATFLHTCENTVWWNLRKPPSVFTDETQDTETCECCSSQSQPVLSSPGEHGARCGLINPLIDWKIKTKRLIATLFCHCHKFQQFLPLFPLTQFLQLSPKRWDIMTHTHTLRPSVCMCCSHHNHGART